MTHLYVIKHFVNVISPSLYVCVISMAVKCSETQLQALCMWYKRYLMLK